MIYGFKNTQKKYCDESCTKYRILLLETFSYYKKKYGLVFESQNDINSNKS